MSIKISQLNEISASNMSGSNYFPIVSDYEAPAFTASNIQSFGISISIFHFNW